MEGFGEAPPPQILPFSLVVSGKANHDEREIREIAEEPDTHTQKVPSVPPNLSATM